MDSLSNYTNVDKVARLKDLLLEYGSVLVAFSGGVDSSFLLKSSLDFLGRDNVLAITSRGSIFPDSELNAARKLAQELNAPWRSIERNPLEEENFRSNPEDRCYHCKYGLFERLKSIAEEEGFKEVCDGSIQDDISGHRPGRLAGSELDIKKPLEDSGFTKNDVRELSKKIGIPDWDKPSNTCLATRIPYGSSITEGKLEKVDAAEEVLRRLGFRGFRVRHHGETARLEVSPEDLGKALKRREQITERLKKLGFTYVTLDLEGYRTGSLNETMT